MSAAVLSAAVLDTDVIGGRSRRRTTALDDDAGTVTVLLAAVIAVAVGLAAVLGVVASSRAAGARAQGAADLAALAAVAAGRADATPPCVVATEVAERNGAALTSCAFAEDGSIEVSVLVTMEPWGTTSAVARAGLVWT